ncbi:uncharacterized protein BXIN_1600 [Babesia sp. Xinjiang]|uniref:uncharacterized protein n=1 Tax=Babesia sp. Xinjiang TaxID=462227 RepID=UPI000A243F6D|nr:uncharacterized protein BXIN_1600 [Babesia sp. Xinjiang]ORM40233.1 hypothetical protein BXIN_1600 [Babesia sp. Xinjiang]
MGFTPQTLVDKSVGDRTGNCIKEILDYFTKKDRNYATLYNIIICLICTGLRTPRTVGDLFSFFLKLGENMNNGGSPKVATAIDTESKNIPWNSYGSKDMTDAANNLAGKKHNGNHTSDPSLYTLYDSDCGNGNTCGSYLDPLSFVIYRNISDIFAMSYLSRIVYLTDVLKEGLKVLLTEFNNLTCEHCTKCVSKPKHKEGEHGNQCKCETIVQCADVLPLFFKFGFVYYSHHALNGKYNNKPEWLRKCSAFYTQLNAVIADGGLFKKLLQCINDFLYCIRKPFLLYLLTFWLIVITYLTYSLTIPLDVLHLRSHLRTAVLSPLVLLTNYTQPHDITYSLHYYHPSYNYNLLNDINLLVTVWLLAIIYLLY